MASRLTKKQQTELTEKLMGVIQKNNALQLRLSADRSVNEMNVNQISGALNRIHGQAIGKELPTEITIPVKQLGSGDPSPDNVRPIVGYEIDGIGTVYGGSLNIDTGTLTIPWGHVVLDGSTRWTMSISGVAYTAENRLFKAATYLDNIKCDVLKTYTYSFQMPDFSITGYRDLAIAYPDNNWLYVSLTRTYETVSLFNEWFTQHTANVIFTLKTPETYTLTPQQMIQLLDQL